MDEACGMGDKRDVYRVWSGNLKERGWRKDDCRIRVRLPAMSDFSVVRNVQTHSGDRTSSCSSTGILFPRVEWPERYAELFISI
jgi:hypothetical protein